MAGQYSQYPAAGGTTLPDQTGQAGKVLSTDGSALSWIATGGTGTVTSVALTLPASVFSVGGSPVTAAGTLAGSLVVQNANKVWAGPTTGPDATPTFRALVAGDVPTLNQNTTGTAANITATTNATLTTLSSLSLPGSQVTGNISGNAANVTGVVALANGGTGQTSATNAINALVPSQTGQSGKFLSTDGSVVSWQTASGGGGATVALDNLVSTNINAGLFFDTDNTYDIGNSTNRVRNLYVKTSIDTGANSFDFTSPNVLNVNTAQMRLHPFGGSGPVAIRLYDAADNNFVGLKAPSSVTTSVTYSWPAADGTNGQVLSTNGSGVMSWATSSGGGITDLTGDVTASGSGSVVATIAAHAVSNSKFRQSAALSLVGNSTNATADVADITASLDGEIMRRSGTSIGFGSIDLAQPNSVGASILPIDNGGTGVATLTTGSVPFMGASTLAEDNTNLNWDSTGKTLAIGGVFGAPGTVPYAQTSQRTVTDPAGIDGAIFGIHYANHTTNNASLSTGLYVEARTQIDAGVTTSANSGVIFQAYRNAGVSDAGALGFLTGAFGGAHQSSTDAAATTDILAGVLSQVDIQSGTANKVADFYGLAGLNGGTITTGQFGVYIEPPGSGIKDNWLSGQALIGGSSYSAHGNTLKIVGDMSADISATDSGAAAGVFNATSNTTTGTQSNTTIGINGSATGLVQSGAENDKEVGGMNFTVTRGDGTDDGILDAMTGANTLIFHNSGTSGVTQKVYGFSTLLFSQQGTVTDLYDFYSERVPAGIGAVTNHYGLYVKADSATPVKNWISGSTLMGFTSFSAPTAVLHLPGVTTSAGTASLKIESGTLMTTPENGAIESDGTDLWWTDDTGTRQQLNGTGGGGANTALSNLAATAVNASIIPDTDVAYDLGSTSFAWQSLYALNIVDSSGIPVLQVPTRELKNASGGIAFDFADATVTYIGPRAIVVSSGLETLKTGDNPAATADETLALQITTGGQQNAAATGKTGNLGLTTGDNNGTNDSGDIIISTGAVASGNRGIVSITGGSISMNAAFLGLPGGSSDPTAPAGSIYYNTGTNKIRWFNGTLWADLL